MKTLTTVLSLCATLAACGGGGGSSPSANTDSKSVALSAQNYDAAATEVMASSATLSASSSTASNLLSGADLQATPSITSFVQSKLPDLIKSWRSKQPQLIGAVSTDSEACSAGGFLTETVNDARGNDIPDPGDYSIITLNDCVEGSVRLNGQMTVTFNSYSESAASPDTFDSTVTVKTNQFTTTINGTTTSTTGSFDLSLSSKYVLGQNGSQRLIDLKINVASLDYNVTTAGTTKVYEYRNYVLETTSYNNQVSQSIKGSINIPTLGSNTATIQTIKNFLSPVASSVTSRLPYPTEGIALVTFKQGGTIRATANGTSSALVELDQDSDGKFETSKAVPWSDIL